MNRQHLAPLPLAHRMAMLALAALLAACGGGGGSDEPGGASLAVSPANRDVVARATVAGMFAMLSPGSLALDGAAASSASRKSPLAVIGPEVQACPYGGSLSLTFDDRDDSLSLTAGDTLTLVAMACREAESRRIDGTASFQFLSVTAGPREAFVARAVMSSLSLQEGARSVAMDGTVRVEYAMLDDTTEKTTVSADGPVTLGVQTMVLNDTLTLSSGFWVESVFDRDAAPPENPWAWGRDTIRCSGSLSSSRAGGSFTVSTSTPLTDYAVDDYPRSGVIRIDGRTGVERLTVLNASAVRVELDAAGDGVYESADILAWDALAGARTRPPQGR